MKKRILSLFLSAILCVCIFSPAVAASTTENVALTASYKGSDIANGTTNYGEANFSVYHSGKLNNGVIPQSSTDTTKGKNVEIYRDGFGAGTTYVYFKLASETEIKTVNAYANHRVTDGNNRGYPTPMKIYVGNSETDISSDTFFGEATTSDTGSVRCYTVNGSKNGKYVILEMGIVAPGIVICLGEIEIYGIPETPDNSVLSTPVLNGNLKNISTYDPPTVKWDAISGATGYDVYIDGKLVAESIKETTYTPAHLEPSILYEKNYGYTTLQVVAKGNGTTTKDSKKSESFNFFYVAKPVDKNLNPVTKADIIIDAGHGGHALGAVNGTRYEKDDNLAMSFLLGEYFERLGFSVAFTRTDDTYFGIMNRAAIANAGEFKLFICVHRNSSVNVGPVGIETLYEKNDSIDKAFAQSVQDAMMELGVFTNRGLSARSDLGVLNNVIDTTPTILLELGFINNDADNERYDKYVNDLALAVVKGTMNYMGYPKETSGSIAVNSKNYSIADVSANATAEDSGSNAKLNIAGDIYNLTGFGEFVVKTSDGEIITEKTYDGKSFDLVFDMTGKKPGEYTFEIYGKNMFPECTHTQSEFKLFTLNVTLKTTCTSENGHSDINEDGICDKCNNELVKNNPILDFLKRLFGFIKKIFDLIKNTH